MSRAEVRERLGSVATIAKTARRTRLGCGQLEAGWTLGGGMVRCTAFGGGGD